MMNNVKKYKVNGFANDLLLENITTYVIES